ncbi:MAG: NRDE family protein [Methylotenera sp.]|uniref:NRDE family protein n=1 Tax=Methylotenera sp. TaxID=2051956 RepID=UPI00248A196E|nr:NRDE family protein [Methylotenera sp.]MDI1310436.1 NRDE family protein [Methylotenera sp.]
MSIIAIASRAHPYFPLIVLMNQDGRHDNKTAPAKWWADAPNCLAGRDETNGGAWFGILPDGRFAAVTSFRDNQPIDTALPPIEQLTVDFLASEDAPVTHVRQFQRNRGSHPPFNLLVGTTRQVYYAGTNTRQPLAVTHGVHTISNGLLDERWPKCVELEQLLGPYLLSNGGFSIPLGAFPRLDKSPARGASALPKPSGSELKAEDIFAASFAMLADRTCYSNSLPNTGVDKDEEARLSACFVMGEAHGTRSSTVLVMARDGKVRFEERSFDAAGNQTNCVIEHWTMDESAFSGGAD